jgi:hypothetical protein
MSRRIKVLVACLMAMLLTVPLVYAWIAWRPVEPLSFEVVGRHQVVEQIPDLLGRGVGVSTKYIYDIEVRNASPATIRLVYAAVLASPSPGTAKNIGVLDLGCAPGYSGKPLEDITLLLPAHGTARLRMTLDEDYPVSGTTVFHQWFSSIRGRASELMATLKSRLGIKFSGHAFDIDNPFDERCAPLHWSDTVPRQWTQPALPAPPSPQ